MRKKKRNLKEDVKNDTIIWSNLLLHIYIAINYQNTFQMIWELEKSSW
jgi:hypothetical protein